MLSGGARLKECLRECVGGSVCVCVCSDQTHVDSYLDCFVSGHFGAKHVLLNFFFVWPFLISFLMSFRDVCASELYGLFFKFYFKMTFVSERARTRAYICFTSATPCVISALIKCWKAVKWLPITPGAFLPSGFVGQVSFIDVCVCCDSDPEKLLKGVLFQRARWRIENRENWGKLQRLLFGFLFCCRSSFGPGSVCIHILFFFFMA